MSDVAVVAAITGGVSVLTSAITAAVTWTVSKNSSRVELAKVDAENRRLLQENQEEERRNRQTTYHEFMNVMTLLYQILGTETPADRRTEICNNYNHLYSGVILFGPPSVRQGARHLHGVYHSIWAALAREEEANPDKPHVQCWRDATADLPSEFSIRFTELADLMHQDVTRGVTEEPPLQSGKSA